MRAERVLVVIDEMEVGGSQRQVVNLLRGLAARGRQASLLYFRNPSYLVDQLVDAGVAVDRIPKRGRVDPVFVWRLARFLRRGRFDLVHCFSITAEAWVRLVISLAPGTRLVCSVRGMSRELSPAAWRAKRWALQRANATISNSVVAAEYVAQRCRLAPDRIDVVPNGLALDAITTTPLPRTDPAPPARDASRPLLLFVGRLVSEKNLPTLLRALAGIDASDRPMLWLAGEGPERRSVEQAIDALGLAEGVVLLGERGDVQSLMAVADALVLPSLEEGLSNAILEAMAAGLPVIASAVGGNLELVVDGRTGLLCDPKDPGSIAAAIRRLFAEPGLRERLTQGSREHVARAYSMERMITRTMAVHDRCMATA